MKPGITVSATGRASVPPDSCLFTIGAMAVRATAAEANAEVNARIATLRSLLAERGVGSDRIQTADLSVWPEHDRDGNPVGIRARHLLRIRLGDIASAGEVVAAATDALGDAAELQGVRFEIEDAAAAESLARRRAWELARARAGELATAASAKLGRAMAIVEKASGSGGRPKMTALAESVPVAPGESEVEVSLTVRFAIG
jgi:uncharacterized protein YggE